MRSALVPLVAALLAAGCIAITPRAQSPGPQAVVLAEVPVLRFGVERCGAGSLAAVIASYGEAVPVEELDDELPKAANGGVLSLDLLLAARQRGFDARLVEGDRELIDRSLAAGRPVILMLRVVNAPGPRGDLYHYVVLDGFDSQRGLVRVQFGDGEARWVRLEKLDRAWRGTGFATILISPGDGASDPESTLAYAVGLESMGRLQEAAGVYRNVLEIDPDWTLAWINLGNVHAARGLPLAAEQAYRRGLELDSRATDGLNNLAWLLLETGGDLDEAEALARRAVRAGGPDPHLAQDTLARVLLASGRCREAISVFRQALRATTVARADRAWLLHGLGLSQRDCGHSTLARESLEEALALSRSRQMSEEIALALGGLVDP